MNMNPDLPILTVACALPLCVVVPHRLQAQDTQPQAAPQSVPVVDVSATKTNHQPRSSIFVTEIPSGYRDWQLVSVAREEGSLNDIRAILANDVGIKAYREGRIPFPEGTIIARLAWSHIASEENNKAFGRAQSFVAGHPTNGVQFMVKDGRKYAETGGWGFAHFNEGKAASEAFMRSCFPCHQAIKSRDLVFTRYSP